MSQHRIGASDIAGAGYFAASDIAGGAVVHVSGLNHSCDPNLVWSGDRLVALRDIAAGEELTYDYATAITDPQFLLRCHCETYRCRQLVTGDDWQIPELRLRYAGHWAPAIQARIDAER